MSICLPAKIKNYLIENIKDGNLDLEKLASDTITSEERRAILEQFVGTGASKEITALFERKILMKNQQEGLISFIRDAIGDRPKVQRDLISKIERLGELLSPEQEAKYYENLISQKLGTKTSFEEGKIISKLADDFKRAKANLTPDLPDGHPKRIDYGAAEVELNDFMNNLRLANEKVGLKETLSNFKKNPGSTSIGLVSDLAGFAKGIKSSLDNSALFRQGWKTLITNPTIWAKNALKTFQDIGSQLGKKASDDTIMKGIKAEIYSRKNAINGLYKKMGLDIGDLEEAFPTTLPEKIPLFGRLYKASQTAYSGFLFRMRADIADQLIEKAVAAGVDMTVPLQQKSLGTLINSLTGRGNLGALEKVAKEVNTIFFSPKMLKSSFDFLTLHATDEMSVFARKQAAINLAKALSAVTTVLGVAYAINPKSVEFDPRSADFGKIRVGNTRFDISGGMSSLVVLASRLITQETKSSTTGKTTKINSDKFGSQTGMDVAVNFAQNKLSPMAALVKDLINQKNFQGEKLTVGDEALNLLVPLGIQNAFETLQDPKAANLALTILADGLGISTNTYGNK